MKEPDSLEPSHSENCMIKYIVLEEGVRPDPSTGSHLRDAA